MSMVKESPSIEYGTTSGSLRKEAVFMVHGNHRMTTRATPAAFIEPVGSQFGEVRSREMP